MSLIDFVYRIGVFILGREKISRIAINRLIGAAPPRPLAWSTRHDEYISWAGLTDKTWFARLLPPVRGAVAEGIGTARPPVETLAKLFVAPAGRQVPCSKSTCLFPAFAQYLTDGFLRTRVFNTPPGAGARAGEEDRRRTTSNHEIDLSALYGRTDKQTDVLRAKVGGRLKTQTVNGEEFSPFLYDHDGTLKAEFCGSDGLLVLDEPLGVKPDSPGRPTMFAVGGDRVNASVQVCAINTLFLREHNRLAGLLLKENPTWDDERLFQVARNILIVKFIRVVVEEYINHISSASFQFSADAAVAWDAGWNRPNWMTIEFTLLYRWHSLVPEEMVWNGKPLPVVAVQLNNAPLLTDGLANTLVQLSANSAARMGLGNIASFLEAAEAKGILQGRVNNLRGYNDYREAMGLPRARSFDDVLGPGRDAADRQRRRDLARELERLYGVVDNLEFYVGLFAEPCQENGPVPELVLAMVAADAFSQALPNPLLCKRIWSDPETLRRTFTDLGVKEITSTSTLRDILLANGGDLGGRFVGMTRQDWRRRS